MDLHQFADAGSSKTLKRERRKQWKRTQQKLLAWPSTTRTASFLRGNLPRPSSAATAVLLPFPTSSMRGCQPPRLPPSGPRAVGNVFHHSLWGVHGQISWWQAHHHRGSWRWSNVHPRWHSPGIQPRVQRPRAQPARRANHTG